MSATVFKIDSPYAKFGSGGQLTCTLCNSAVKSAKVWIAHVNGRQHRENLATGTARKTQPQQSQKPLVTKIENASLKRPASTKKSNGRDVSDGVKKAKTMSTDRGIQQIPAAASNSRTPAPARSLVQAASDSGSESEEDTYEYPVVKLEVRSTGDLPADFFDAGTSSAADQKPDPSDMKTSELPKQVDAMGQKSGELPEGFFDDRKVDAKIRGVELKDPLDEEWSKFQKEMQKVEVASEQIIEEDEDQMTLERELDEAEEQMREWSRINELEKRKEAVAEPGTENLKVPFGDRADETSSIKGQTDDEADDVVSLEQVLDWRSKDVWK